MEECGIHQFFKLKTTWPHMKAPISNMGNSQRVSRFVEHSKIFNLVIQSLDSQESPKNRPHEVSMT